MQYTHRTESIPYKRGQGVIGGAICDKIVYIYIYIAVAGRMDIKCMDKRSTKMDVLACTGHTHHRSAAFAIALASFTTTHSSVGVQVRVDAPEAAQQGYSSRGPYLYLQKP